MNALPHQGPTMGHLQLFLNKMTNARGGWARLELTEPLFVFIILARNIDCKSILQKTLKQFGLVASKYERKSRYKSNFQCVSLRRRVCLCPVYMSRDMFLQSAFQFGFLPSKPCLFPLESSLEFVLHRGKSKFNSLPVKFPADRSKF